MGPHSLSIPWRAALLAVAICALSGCDTRLPQKPAPAMSTLSEAAMGKKQKKDPKSNKDLNKSEDDVRNEALEQISKTLDKQNKAAEEAAKNGAKAAKNGDKNKSKKDDPTMPRVFTTGAAPIVELDRGEKNDKKLDRSIPFKSGSSGNGHFAEITGPGQKSPTYSGDTANLSKNGNAGQKKGANDSMDMKVMEGRGSAQFGDAAISPNDEKPGFFSRVFGSKKAPETKVVRQGEVGKQFELTNEQADKKHLGQVFAEKPDGTTRGVQNSPADEKRLRETYNPFGSKDVPARESFKSTPAEKQSLESQRIASEFLRVQLKNEADLRQKKELQAAPDAAKKALHPITDFEPAPAAKKDAVAVPPSAGVGSATFPAMSSASVSPTATGMLPIPGSKMMFNPNETAPITASDPINTSFNDTKYASAEKAAQDAAASNRTKSENPVAAAPDSDAAVNEAQRQLGSFEQYRRGLGTRDIVAREAAFQRAAAERREDAIPALVEEVERNGLLAVTAARVLAIIGKNAGFVEHGLMVGLNTTNAKESALREACAETLGQLRSRRAVPMLMEKAKMDKSYTVRSACVASLGMIGDSSAITTLHMKLDDLGEIEFVKQSAALALARMGDSAGREHLVKSLDSSSPAYQVLGLTGLAQLNDSGSPGYLISALDSRYDEVWTTAIQLFPRIGARLAVPMLRRYLGSGNETMRIRASLALGLFGCSDGVALICRAARSGSVQERILGCELLGQLGRKEQVPLLIDKLGDPSSNVRQTAAAALTLLDAKEAVPQLMESARGRFKNQLIQPVNLGEHPEQREHDSRSILSVQVGSPTDMSERMVMLACVRSLRGEKDDLVLRTLPSSKDSSWPEFDRELLKQQVDVIKMYKLLDVVPSGTSSPGALIQVPGGQEILYRRGEIISGGFKIREVSLGAPSSEGKGGVPPYVTLQRGDERITLYQGQESEVESGKSGAK